MRICFDLDGTLCDGVKPYQNSKPLPGISSLLKELKSAGHTIIISTARNMSDANYNPGVATKNIGLLTLQQLEDWDFVYDEIYFGKPSADLYIDDKAMTPGDFINGFTNS